MELIKGASIHDRFPIRKVPGGPSVGTIEIKVSVIDIDVNPSQSRVAQQA